MEEIRLPFVISMEYDWHRLVDTALFITQNKAEFFYVLGYANTEKELCLFNFPSKLNINRF